MLQPVYPLAHWRDPCRRRPSATGPATYRPKRTFLSRLSPIPGLCLAATPLQGPSVHPSPVIKRKANGNVHAATGSRCGRASRGSVLVDIASVRRKVRSRVVVVSILAVLVVAVASPAAPASTYLGCGYRGDVRITARPRACFLDWPDLPLAYAISLHDLRWRTWSGAVAAGTAVYKVKDRDPWTRVRVRAYARRDCGTQFRYTRVRVFGPGWAHTWRTVTCAYVA